MIKGLTFWQWVQIVFLSILFIYILTKVITKGVLTTIDQHKKNKELKGGSSNGDERSGKRGSISK